MTAPRTWFEAALVSNLRRSAERDRKRTIARAQQEEIAAKTADAKTVSLPCHCSFHDPATSLDAHSLHILAARDPEAKEKFAAEVKRGVDVNVRNAAGATALLVATRANCVADVRALLELKADVNAADNAGWTPLIEALRAGVSFSLKLLDIVQLLLAYKADVYDARRRTAGGEDWASGKTAMEIVAEQRKRGYSGPAYDLIDDFAAIQAAPTAPPAPRVEVVVAAVSSTSSPDK
jgi:uncharacterized protein